VAGGLSQIREIAGGGSYLSQSDLRANFGLGKATRVESVEISWPSGLKQVFHDVEAGKFYQVVEGKDQLGLQKTWPSHEEKAKTGSVGVRQGTF
jgi:hypothetical protein